MSDLETLARGVMAQYGVVVPDPKRWIPQVPTPRQLLFLGLSNLEAFYGGAAGGAKSSALLMGALQYFDIPGYSAIIFRRTLTDLKLPEALMARSHEWLDKTAARWNGTEMQWKSPTGGILQFGYLDSDDDIYRYQSAAFQYVAFDELSHFKERQYRFLFSRLRKLAGAAVPLRMRSASNPGGPGQLWVKNRFIPDGFMPMHAEELRVRTKPIVYDEEERELLTAMLEPGEQLPTYRVFVPARMQDNPHLDQRSYAQSLFQLDRVTREQMLKGDWSIQVLGRQRFHGPSIEQFEAKRGTCGELRLKVDPFGSERVEFYANPDGPLEVWLMPDPKRTYSSGADTAEGKEMSEDEANSDPDFSVAHISEANTGQQCARLRGRIPEAQFGEMLYALLRWYNSPFIVPEVKGGYGRATLNKLLDMGYPQALIFNRHLMSELQGLPPYRGQVSAGDLGWNTMPTNRPLLISFLDDAILKHTIEIYDAVTIEELRHFCYNAIGKAEAESGYHDDCVLAKCFDEVARIFAKKLEPMRRRQAIGAAQNLSRKYGAPPPKRDLEEEDFWRRQGMPIKQR